jgi:hypothetical protein
VNWHFKTPAGATAKLAGNLVDAFTGQMSSDALFQRFAYPRPAKSYPGLSTPNLLKSIVPIVESNLLHRDYDRLLSLRGKRDIRWRE